MDVIDQYFRFQMLLLSLKQKLSTFLNKVYSDYTRVGSRTSLQINSSYFTTVKLSLSHVWLH